MSENKYKAWLVLAIIMVIFSYGALCDDQLQELRATQIVAMGCILHLVCCIHYGMTQNSDEENKDNDNLAL